MTGSKSKANAGKLRKKDAVSQKTPNHALPTRVKQGHDKSTAEVQTVNSEDAISLRNQQQSRLLRLPAELRNKVYEYALGGVRLWAWPNTKPRGFKLVVRDQSEPIGKGEYSDPQFLSALLVCRQIHAETALLPLQLNHIRIMRLDTFHLLQATLTKDQRNAIRIIKILVRDLIKQSSKMADFWRGENELPYEAFLPLRNLAGLERLIIEGMEDAESSEKLKKQDLRGLARQYGGHSGVEVIFSTVAKA